jgi:hypothetical protein
MAMDLLLNVKFSNVLLLLKTFGELNTAQTVIQIFSVTLHTPVSLVLMLGIVKTSYMPLKQLWMNLIPTVMVKSTMVTTLLKNIY